MATLASVPAEVEDAVPGAGGVVLPPAQRHRSEFFAGVLLSAQRLLWALLSIGMFTLIWEMCWLVGLADPKLLPPPHIFLGDMAEQAKYFNTATRWSIGVNPADGPSPYQAVLITIGATTMRVLVGLMIASVLGISIGVLVRYFLLFERLTLPTITLLSPVSPIAWLPVAIFLFGIGNAPAIFMVVIALFFHMVLATISQIDGVNRNLINVARTMGASKWQTYARVIIPAILPGLLVVLRMNLFAAWMVVLVAESTGVGYGLGQVIMMARNTFNPSLVFFTIALIGLLGFTFDLILRLLQRRILYWVPETVGVLRGL
ncbi:MAG TPA: ABC transporter permease [Hyphomicrobiaceae bacterium]|nr:ABC transporter permease [Hyphomicrobiaceae bacterium]